MNEPTTGRHPLDVTQLVMGVAFLALAGVWALITADVIEAGDLPWVLPFPWILAGLGGLLAVTLRQRRQG
jgi:hypothetical protein